MYFAALLRRSVPTTSRRHPRNQRVRLVGSVTADKFRRFRFFVTADKFRRFRFFVCLRHEPEAILARGESGSSRSDLCDLDRRAGACWRTPLRPSYGRGGKAETPQGMLPRQWAAYLGPLPNVACRSGAPRAGLPSAVRRAAAAREDSSNLKWWLSQPGSSRLAFNDCRYGVAE